MRNTCQPASRSSQSVSRSRSRLRSTFQRHHSALLFGAWWCSGQPCQKHPSTYTARRALVNAMSIVRRLFPGTFICTRKRMPLRCSSRRSAISGLVSRRARVDILRLSAPPGLVRPGSSAGTGASLDTSPAKQNRAAKNTGAHAGDKPAGGHPTNHGNAPPSAAATTSPSAPIGGRPRLGHERRQVSVVVPHLDSTPSSRRSRTVARKWGVKPGTRAHLPDAPDASIADYGPPRPADLTARAHRTVRSAAQPARSATHPRTRDVGTPSDRATSLGR